MRLAALTSAMLLVVAAPAMAQPYETPQALLEAFYQPYFTDDFYDDESMFRSVELQALYDRDAEVTPEGELGALSFDPYIDGQDYQITDFEIGAPGIAGDYALADVTFENMGVPKSLTYELVREGGGWKIDDVVSTTPGSEYRLSEIFESAVTEE